MNTILNTSSVVYAMVLIVALLNLVDEIRRDLMMLQQNSYRNERYLKWLRQSGDTTTPIRLCGMAVFLFSMSTMSLPMLSMMLILAVAATNSYKLMTRRYKKPLVMTRRAWRILITALVVSLIVIIAATAFAYDSLSARMSTFDTIMVSASVTSIGLYFFSHAVILAANTILKPVEKSINDSYRRDAERILASMPDLKVIGITGSYGKTSTKHYLHRILSEQFDTCMTPGSFNTTLGVIRTIREHLKPYNEVFIVEMGAKQRGDIKEIAELVKPTMCIVTAVGPQHLESFKTIENVADTKFELVDSLPADGTAVINNDFEPIAQREVGGHDNIIRYGVSNVSGTSYNATDIVYSAGGTSFTVNTPSGESLKFHTHLVGECNVSNLLAAIIIALKLGVDESKIRYAVEKIEQVEHRLQIKRTASGITILDDAFNSNPAGSSMALDVLARLTGGKRIIITPGMIELGDRQEDLNRAFGQKIAVSADIAIVVGQYNRQAITEGIAEGGMNANNVHSVDTFSDAQKLLQTIVKPGDTVLYENDLPDTFK